MLARGVNHKWEACPSKDITQAPVHPYMKLMNVNHMSMMKTNLAVISMCPRGCFVLYKSSSRLILCYKKDCATLLHFFYTYYLLPITNYLITKLSVTDNFSAFRIYFAENRLSFSSAPCWVRHSYLSKGLRLIPYTCGSSRIFYGTVSEE